MVKEQRKLSEKERKAAKEAAEKDGWEFLSKPGHGPKTITVEEGKREQEEALEALRKLHKELGAKSPEEIKKEQEASKGLV